MFKNAPMKKLYLTLLSAMVFTVGQAQNVNYTTEIVEFYQTGCNDGAGSDEEPTWKVYTRDNISTIWEGGFCHFVDGNIPIVYIPGSDTHITTKTNTSATLIDVRFEAWEDDCDGGSGSDRCSFSSSCLLGTQEDDCLEFHDPLAGPFGAYPSIDFRNDPQCVWNEYTFNAGDFGVKIRVKWEYFNFTAGSNIDVCDTIAALAGAGSGVWSVSSGTGGTFSDVNDPQTDFFGDAGETYVLDWNTLAGCETSNSDNITVNVHHNPDPQLEVDQDPVCEGADLVLSAQDGITYEFAINSTSNVTQTGGSDSYMHTSVANTDTLALVTVTNADGCSITESLVLDVLPAPNPLITRTGSDLSTGNYSFYQWYYNGSPISGETTQDYTATANGSYTVQVIDTNGCIGESSPVVITNVSIAEFGKYFFKAYPNPVQDMLIFETDLEVYEITFSNAIGAIITREFSPASLDVSSYPSGIYLLTVTSEGSKATKKIIIQ